MNKIMSKLHKAKNFFKTRVNCLERLVLNINNTEVKMILKDKQVKNVKSRTTIAGQKQELDVAFYLRREFKDHPEVFIINDYTFSHNDETAQIDHLIIYPFGFILIESKSISGEIKINEQGEWTRSFQQKWSGIPSPIKQVELQEKLLQELLHHHRASILGKILGFKQQSFRLRCWHTLCAVSSNAIIARQSMPYELSNTIVKSEFLVDRLKDIMNLKTSMLKSINVLDTRPDFSHTELASITSFLMSQVKKEIRESKLTHHTSQSELADVKAILVCKNCGMAKDCIPKSGKYGYYIHCNECNKNTPMRMPCIQCKSKNTKVFKRENNYNLQCIECGYQNKLIIRL